VDAARQGVTFHDFEQALWRHLLRAGRAATQEFLDAQGTGDLGEAVQLPDGQQARRLAEPHPRPLTGVFGTFTLCRACYGTREGQKVVLVPLDDRRPPSSLAPVGHLGAVGARSPGLTPSPVPSSPGSRTGIWSLSAGAENSARAAKSKDSAAHPSHLPSFLARPLCPAGFIAHSFSSRKLSARML
jgi:hypothetical protein